MKIFILAGGSGTRLWPLSRTNFPKQFLALGGHDSFLQKTVKRNLGLVDSEDLYILTNELYLQEIVRQNRNLPKKNILCEPTQKNTAPAILFALDKIGADGDEMVLICPADHVIAPQIAYERHVKQAEKWVQKGYLVTFGVRPSKPETGYGYIKIKQNRVVGFTEKPDLKRAQEYIQSGDYFWNSGMFAFTSTVFYAELRAHAPELFGKPFEALPAISIDYALMEKSKNLAVVPLDLTWSDVGSWENVYEFLNKNEAQNVMQGDVCTIDTTDSLILAENRHVSTIGLKNIVVVETEDAVLVADKYSSQKVKDLVAELRQKKRKETEEHATVLRPWGKYTVLLEKEHYKIKKICVEPHQKLSLQLHHHRSEHWVVVTGQAKIRLGNIDKLLIEGESTFVPQKMVHRLENPTNDPLEMIEIQVGTYLGEDDIVRFDDIYGRDVASMSGQI